MTAYPVSVKPGMLFLAQTNSHTLSNDGPATVYVSSKPNPDTASCLPISLGGTVIWDSGSPCYAVADIGGAVLRVNDNSGSITNPTAIANAIISQGLAQQIANAIAIKPLNVSAAQVNISGAQAGATSPGGFTVPDSTSYLSYTGTGSAVSQTITPAAGKGVSFRTFLAQFSASTYHTLTFTLYDATLAKTIYQYKASMPGTSTAVATLQYTTDLLGLGGPINSTIVVSGTLSYDSSDVNNASGTTSLLYKVT